MNKLLDYTPPPPPDDVPEIEPDVRGTITLRQQLIKHRADPSCAQCHDKIDPAGFALENYDAIGSWRDYYPDKLPVDASGKLDNGETFDTPPTFANSSLLEKNPSPAASLKNSSPTPLAENSTATTALPLTTSARKWLSPKMDSEISSSPSLPAKPSSKTNSYDPPFLQTHPRPSRL